MLMAFNSRDLLLEILDEDGGLDHRVDGLQLDRGAVRAGPRPDRQVGYLRNLTNEETSSIRTATRRTSPRRTS